MVLEKLMAAKAYLIASPSQGCDHKATSEEEILKNRNPLLPADLAIDKTLLCVYPFNYL